MTTVWVVLESSLYLVVGPFSFDDLLSYNVTAGDQQGRLDGVHLERVGLQGFLVQLEHISQLHLRAATRSG